MSNLVIENIRALEPGVGIIAEAVHITDGKIVKPDAETVQGISEPERIDGGGRLLTPGLIDLHAHGIGPVSYEAGPEALREGLRRVTRHGTTCVLPTLTGSMSPERFDHLASLAEALDEADGASAPGLHLEGPFVGLPGAMIPIVPGDVELLEALWDTTGGRVKAMSVSPEVSGILPVIERLCRRDIVPMITHTRATAEETLEAIEAGARHATHFYDVFPVPDETDPGVRPVGAVEAILAETRCTVDFICDGIHVAPVAIRAALAAKGYRGLMLITDANVGAGLPEGMYDTPAGYPIKISRERGARIHDPKHPLDGALAGSTLTMERGITNLLRWLDLPPEQIWAMGTSNPARLLGLEAKGTLREGADADLVLWEETDEGLSALKTWVGGRCVHDGQADAAP